MRILLLVVSLAFADESAYWERTDLVIEGKDDDCVVEYSDKYGCICAWNDNESVSGQIHSSHIDDTNIKTILEEQTND